MSEVETDSSRSNTTIILIGGTMTVEDGSTIDTRQKIANDPACRIMQSTLATSLLWWTTAVSVVKPILASVDGHPYAIVIGNRSVTDLRSDGSLKRTRLTQFLPGGVSSIEIARVIRDEQMPDGFVERWHDTAHDGSVWNRVGVKLEQPERPWRYLKGSEYFFTDLAPSIGPSVIVDTTGFGGGAEKLYSGQYALLEKARLATPGVVLVMPHTRRAESVCRGYLRWVGKGRPAPTYAPASAFPEWKPDAPPDPRSYTNMSPASASFGVTGLVQDGEWRDPGALEAARSLLEARYDLKLGIWDLVSNDVLRTSLLKTLPRQPVPRDLAPLPELATNRAEKQVRATVAKRDEAQQEIKRVSAQLGSLTKLGWTPGKAANGWLRTLPLTEPMKRWEHDDPFPLVQLELSLNKRQMSISAFTIMYNQVNIRTYIEERSELFARIASPSEIVLRDGRPVIWTASGGWGDEVDWGVRTQEIADKTPLWREALEDLCDECLRIRNEPRPEVPGVYVRLEAHLENGQVVVSSRSETAPRTG